MWLCTDAWLLNRCNCFLRFCIPQCLHAIGSGPMSASVYTSLSPPHPRPSLFLSLSTFFWISIGGISENSNILVSCSISNLHGKRRLLYRIGLIFQVGDHSMFLLCFVKPLRKSDMVVIGCL